MAIWQPLRTCYLLCLPLIVGEASGERPHGVGQNRKSYYDGISKKFQ
jgi:hypothetical protein